MGLFQALSAFRYHRQRRETFMKNLATPDVYKFVWAVGLFNASLVSRSLHVGGKFDS